MLNKAWRSIQRLTVGEIVKNFGGARGGSARVDIRRFSNDNTSITLTLTSGFSIEFNGHTTSYTYLSDAAAERLASDLMAAVQERKKQAQP